MHRYSSYLLRIWEVPESGWLARRVTLQDVATGQRIGFDDLAGLMVFLAGHAHGDESGQPEPDDDGSATGFSVPPA